MSSSVLHKNFTETLKIMKIEHRTTEAIADFINKRHGIKVYAKTTLDNYYNNSESVKPSRMLAFIAAADRPSPPKEEPPPQRNSYDQINDVVMGSVKSPFPKELLGLYRYWRFFPDSLSNEDLRWGIVRITATEFEGCKFEHWSTDIISPILKNNKKFNSRPFDVMGQLREPEDTGHAFYASEVLMTLGFREGNIRLALAQAQPKNLSTIAINGMILSKRNPGNLIFSSCFLMFHASHSDVNEVIRSADFHARTKFYVGVKKKLMVWS